MFYIVYNRFKMAIRELNQMKVVAIFCAIFSTILEVFSDNHYTLFYTLCVTSLQWVKWIGYRLAHWIWNCLVLFSCVTFPRFLSTANVHGLRQEHKVNITQYATPDHLYAAINDKSYLNPLLLFSPYSKCTWLTSRTLSSHLLVPYLWSI